MSLRKWVAGIVREVNSRAEVSVSQHEIGNIATRTFQIWEIGNGWLLMEYPNHDFGGSSDRRVKYYSDLQSLYEGMVTSRAQEKLGINQYNEMANEATVYPYPVTTSTV